MYPDSVHVVAVDLDEAVDGEIWVYAAENDYVVVSKEADFRQLAFLYGPPPKVVRLRVGNGPTKVIEDLLRQSVERIEEFVDDDEESRLILSPTE